MRILLTGSSGRVGRAIHVRLRAEHDVVGLDVVPSATADIVADVSDEPALRAALDGTDAVVHVAALHAPHVGRVADAAFEDVNVRGTALLLRLALEAGVGRFVFTSTTALYGAGADPDGGAAWVTEDTIPRPRTIYHHTKLAGERLVAAAAATGLAATILRMSRCFPEPAPRMAAYRLHRGVDARDVAEAHAAALAARAGGCRTFVVSGATPFLPGDAPELARDAPAVLARRAPELVAAFARRRWPLPPTIDRVYDSARAARDLPWTPRYGFDEVLAEMDRGSPDVLRA